VTFNTEKPKANDSDIYKVLQRCKVFLSSDETTELYDFIQKNKDNYGGVNMIDVSLFLAAIGLPA